MLATSAIKSSAYRRKARMVGQFADCAQSADDRQQLQRMRESLLARADNADWANGVPPLPSAPSAAMAIPRLRNSV